MKKVYRSTSKRTNTKECTCNFGFVLFCTTSTGGWYIAKHNTRHNNPTRLVHQYHIQIQPDHTPTSKTDLPQHIQKELKVLVTSGISNSAAVTTIRNKYNICIKEHILNSLRNDTINDFLSAHPDSNGPFPQSSVDRLISLFTTLDNVNFVYVKHSITSGFVTYRKNKTEGIHQTFFDNTLKKDIECWRKQLKIGDSKEILVSFGWCHDDEKRNFLMFPEIVGTDMTFGLNKERRNLVTFVGINGSKKAFTCFRCWMPSKQMVAYQWAINVAFPTLMSQKITSKNRTITSDAEASLVKAILTSTANTNAPFPYSKFRIDFFHYIVQPWNKFIGPCDTKHNDFHSVTTNIRHWMKSFFSYVESKEEMKDSMKRLECYIDNNIGIVGEFFSQKARELIRDVVAETDKIAHYNFMFHTTLGYIGSQMVESMNPSIKTGHLGCTSNMNIDYSSYQQTKQVEHKRHKDQMLLSCEINETKHWTRSSTSNFLTRYMEGIFLKNFDIRKIYHKSYIGNNCWYVLHKGVLNKILSTDNEEDIHFPMKKDGEAKYNRVRVVSIDNDGFITCSCGYVQRYLCPCRHVCCVLDREEFIRAELFHIRWWKHYNYYFCNDFAINEMRNLHESLIQVNNKLYEEAYDTDGRYKGCLLSGNPFLKCEHQLDTHSEKYKVMKAIINHTSNIGPVLSGDDDVYRKISEDVSVEVVSNTFEISDDEGINNSGIVGIEISSDNEDASSMQLDTVDSFGIGELGVGRLSQHSVEMESFISGKSKKKKSKELVRKGDDLWNRTEGFLKSIKTQEQRERFETFLREEWARNQAENNPSYVDNEQLGTLMFGSDVSGRCDSNKRKRMQYEKHRSRG